MSADRAVPVRVLLAVGDRELERRLTHELPAAGVQIAARCLDGPSLLERAGEPGIDVVLAAADLHRLGDATLVALRERRRPVVLLVADLSDAERLAELASVVPAAAGSAVVATAVLQAEAHGPGYAGRSGIIPNLEERDEHGDRGRVIAVASGKGAPGKTTVAIALAASLAGAGLRVVLVDADLRGGNVAPYLDLEPRRGLLGLAAGSGLLAGRLGEELQDGPGFQVLAGVERPELAAGVREETLAAAIGTLRDRFERVIVDAGVPPEPAVLRGADEVLIVSGADLVSVWNAQVGLRAIREGAGGAALSAVVNRRDGREHYERAEIERALGIPVLGVVREDRKAARRAIAKQLPLSEVGGRAARELRAIAAALEAGRADAYASGALPRPALLAER